eukprot:5434435-Alexandrium_andersonii.AAC.1
MAFCKYLRGCAICFKSAARNPNGRHDGRLLHCFWPWALAFFFDGMRFLPSGRLPTPRARE